MIDGSLTFLDSGIGGLPYLDWVVQHRSGIPVAYVADSANFPYGELDKARVCRVLWETARKIFDVGTPCILTVACNTASVSALEGLRKFAPCPVVGTVPAVKPAAGLPNRGPIGVLATEGTVKSEYLDRLVDSFALGRKVIRVAAGDIVRYVEEQWLADGDKGAVPVMRQALETLRKAAVESLVIGCTHFLHVLDPIAQAMGPGVTLVDSRDGVGRRILSLLEERNYTFEKSLQGPGKAVLGAFYLTGSSDSARYRRFAHIHGLEWAGVLG